MNTYLAIITTILVLTQIVRLAQNHIQLKGLRNHVSQNDKVAQMWEDLKDSIEELSSVIKHKK